jgi:hypothetical protein
MKVKLLQEVSMGKRNRRKFREIREVGRGVEV